MKVKLSEFLKENLSVSSALEAIVKKFDGAETEVIFDKKEYFFDNDHCENKIIYMTNTVSELEMPVPNRKIGILLENARNLTLDGNGCKLLYNGRLCEFVLQGCSNVTIKNFIVDFVVPTVAEFDVVAKTMTSIDIVPSMDSFYTFKNGVFKFDVDDFDTEFVMQECDRANGITRRVDMLCWHKSFFDKQSGTKQIDEKTFRISTSSTMFFTVGMRYQICSAKRDGAGTFMEHCNDIVLSNNHYMFMHGMGILAQLCNNITVTDCKFTPNREKDRTTASFADMIHASMCSGVVTVKNCDFDGSRDDIINVHGNHFSIKKIKNNELLVKWMHPQTYGFNAFEKGDEIEFIIAGNLIPIGTGEVVSSELTSPRITRIVLKDAVPRRVRAGNCVENVTRTASLVVDNIEGRNIPTRGILVTTRKPVVIKNSRFIKNYMHCIHIADDAMNWYESGYVCDVQIINNTFEDCMQNTVSINPSTSNLLCGKPIHKNIVIKDNTFVQNKEVCRFFLKNVENVVIEGSKFVGNDKFILKKLHAKKVCLVK